MTMTKIPRWLKANVVIWRLQDDGLQVGQHRDPEEIKSA